MTQQRQNEMMLAGESFGLAEADGDLPEFDPERHGLPLEFAGSACWDGTAEMERYRSEWEAWRWQPFKWQFVAQPGDPEGEARALAEWNAYREELFGYSRFFGSRRRVRGRPQENETAPNDSPRPE